MALHFGLQCTSVNVTSTANLPNSDNTNGTNNAIACKRVLTPNGIGGKMRCKLLRKGLLQKQEIVSNNSDVSRHKYIFLELNRCTFLNISKLY